MVFSIYFTYRFQPETRHTFANNIPHNIPVFRGQYSLQAMLNVVDQNIFPLIEQNVKVTRDLFWVYSSWAREDSIQNAIFVSTNLVFLPKEVSWPFVYLT